MTNLVPVSVFDDVYQLEQTDLAIAGEGGIMNLQAQALLNRTQYLFDNMPSGGGTGGVDVVATPEAFPGLDPTGSTVPSAVAANTLALQAFFDACKGKRGFLPAGRYKKNAQITLDPSFSYCIEGAGWNSENGTPQGTSIEETNDSNGLFIYYANANFPGGPAGAVPPRPNSDNRVRIARMAFRGPNVFTAAGTQTIGIEGVNTVVPKGTGIYCYWVQGLELEDVWISQYQRDGVYGYRCFSTVFRNVWTIKNNYSGLVLFKTANAVSITGIKSLVNGRVPATSPHYSISITSDIENFASLGPVIDGASDVSYTGNDGSSPFYHSISKGNLTNIVVSGGIATANGSGFAYSAGQVIGVSGCLVQRALNSLYATVLTGATISTLTFAAPGVPNGTYTDAGLAIGPYGIGIGLNQVFGGLVNAYCEDPSGLGIYMGSQCKGVLVQGGYYQDAMILADTGARGISMQNVHFAGIRAGDYWTDLAGMAQRSGLQYYNLSGRGQAGSYLGGTAQNIRASNFQTQGIMVWPGGSNGGLPQPSNLACGNGALNLLDTTNTPVLGTAFANCAFGTLSGGVMTTGNYNTVLGYQAGLALTTGGFNTVVGANALASGGGNVQNSCYMGYLAGVGVTSGGDEVAIGVQAGSKGGASATNGKNVYIGTKAGATSSTQVWGTCTIIGHQDAASIAGTGVTNFVGIGYNTQFNADVNRVQMGNNSISTAVVQVAWTIASDSRFKTNVAPLPTTLGLDYIKLLTPVAYDRLAEDGESIVELPRRDASDVLSSASKEVGLIAQDVEAVTPAGYSLVFHDETQDRYGIRYNDLIICLVKAVQELEARVASLEGP